MFNYGETIALFLGIGGTLVVQWVIAYVKKHKKPEVSASPVGGGKLDEGTPKKEN